MQVIETTTLSPLERALSRWAGHLAPFVPNPIKPNHITVAGFGAALAGAISFGFSGNSNYWLLAAIVGVACHMVTDSLDGAVARYRGETSERGFLLDQMLDGIVFVALPVGIGFSPHGSMEVMVFPVLALFLHESLILYRMLLLGQKLIPRFGPIDYELVVILTTILTAFDPGMVAVVAGRGFTWFDILFGVGAALSLVEFFFLFFRLVRSLPGIRQGDRD